MIPLVWTLTALALLCGTGLIAALHLLLGLSPEAVAALKPLLDTLPEWLGVWLPGWQTLALWLLDGVQWLLGHLGTLSRWLIWALWLGWGLASLVLLGLAALLHGVIRASQRLEAQHQAQQAR